MTIARYLTPSRVRLYETCPLAYKLKYIDRLIVGGPAAPALVAGSVLHAALATYHERKPAEPGGVLDCVSDAVECAVGDHGREAVEQARGQVAACLLEYHGWPDRPDDPERWMELDLKAPAGPMTLACRADLVTRRHGTVTSVEFKMSMPPVGELLQQVFSHAALRLRFPDDEIVHRIVAFRRDGQHEIGGRIVELSEQDYRRTLAYVFAVARAIGGELEWLPTPSTHACSVCDHRGLCPHAEALIERVLF